MTKILHRAFFQLCNIWRFRPPPGQSSYRGLLLPWLMQCHSDWSTSETLPSTAVHPKLCCKNCYPHQCQTSHHLSLHSPKRISAKDATGASAAQVLYNSLSQTSFISKFFPKQNILPLQFFSLSSHSDSAQWLLLSSKTLKLSARRLHIGHLDPTERFKLHLLGLAYTPHNGHCLMLFSCLCLFVCFNIVSTLYDLQICFVFSKVSLAANTKCRLNIHTLEVVTETKGVTAEESFHMLHLDPRWPCMTPFQGKTEGIWDCLSLWDCLTALERVPSWDGLLGNPVSPSLQLGTHRAVCFG